MLISTELTVYLQTAYIESGFAKQAVIRLKLLWECGIR